MAKVVDLNTYDPNLIYQLDLPMPAWRWVAKFTGPSIPGVNFDHLVIEKVTLPNGESLPASGSFGSGRTTYYPDFPEVSTISVDMYETQAGVANLSLTNWQLAVKSRDGWYGIPTDYKCELRANLFGYLSNTQSVLTYSAEGVWPTDAGSLDLNYTEDNRTIVTATFSCDRILKGTRAG